MMKKVLIAWFVVAIAINPLISLATPFYGITLSWPYRAKEPDPLYGYQVFLTYDPDTIKSHQFNVYFDAGFSHFWINRLPYYTSVSIYSIAPILRYTFFTSEYIATFAEVSVGLSYLNHTRIDSRNLGIHFAFQDRLGFGALLGRSKRLSIGLHAVHYSNAHLSSHNSGITIPFVIDIGYRFN